MQFILSLFLAVAGGYIGMKTRLPAGAMLGALFTVLFFNIWVQDKTIELPRNYSFFCQCAVGLLVAGAYSPQLLQSLAKLWLPVIISCSTLILTGIIMALVIHYLGYMDFPTAYISTSPGAMNVLVSISPDLKADTALVASFHFVRTFIVSLTAPLVFKLFRYLAGI